MKSLRLLVPILLLACSSGALGAAAEDAELGRYWLGLYTSHRGMDEGEYRLTVVQATEDGETIIVKSKGQYINNGETHDIRMEWVINTETLFVEMWDVAANDDDDYEASGAYAGSISRDLKRIFVIWRNIETNNAGTLKLRSVESLPDEGK